MSRHSNPYLRLLKKNESKLNDIWKNNRFLETASQTLEKSSQRWAQYFEVYPLFKEQVKTQEMIDEILREQQEMIKEYKKVNPYV